MFVNNFFRKVREKYPKLGMFIQSAPVSVLFGLFYGYLIFTFKGADVAAKLRKSFEPLFMNFFLPFIINDGAVNAFPRKSFFKNILPVLCFAIIGTGVAIISTGVLVRLVSAVGILQKVGSVDAGLHFLALIHLLKFGVSYRHGRCALSVQGNED